MLCFGLERQKSYLLSEGTGYLLNFLRNEKMDTRIVDEEKLRSQFAASTGLQAEFGNDVKDYVAFKRAEAAGRVQISKPGGCQMVEAEQFRDEVQLDELNEKLAANEAELKRLSGLQEKSVEDEASQYAAGVAC